MRNIARIGPLVILALALEACSAGPGSGSGAGSVEACDLATPEMVAAAFGGSSSEGVAGEARNCQYTLTGGSIPTVNVYYYGPADDWDGIRVGFDENRGGTTDVSGIGEVAYHPNDAGPLELVVQAGDVVFSVSGGFFAEASVEEAVAELASAIADDQ